MKKKILVFSDCYTYSGSENVIENLIKSSLLQKDYEISFFYGYNDEYHSKLKIKLSEFYGKSVFPIKILSEVNIKNKLSSSHKTSILYYLYLFIFILLYLIRLSGFFSIVNFFIFRTFFKKNQPDILFINNGGYPGALSCRIAAIAGKSVGIKKIIFVVNNMAFAPRNFFDRLLDNRVDLSVNFFVTASHAAMKRLISVRKFPSEKCINISNTLFNQDIIEKINFGLLRKELKIGKNEFVIGSIGLLTKRKGFNVLLDAINILNINGNFENCKCVIIGEGEERESLNSKIIKYGLHEKVILSGYKYNALEYLKDFDIFVLPSTNNEDFPYVIIEAMLLSKPIISTKVAGIPEQVLDNITGFIVPPFDEITLAEKISFFVNNREEIEIMGSKAKERYLELFSYDKIINDYKKLFK